MRSLIVSTVSKSLVFQSPSMYDVLRQLGHELVLAAAPDQYVDYLPKDAEFVPLPFSRKGIRKAVVEGRNALKKLIESEQFGLIQVQSPIAAMMLRSISQAQKSPVIYIAHGFHFHADGSRLANFAFGVSERSMAKRTSAIGLVSGEDFTTATAMGFPGRTLLWRLPGAGVDTSAFEGVSEAAAQNCSPARPRQVLFCGELNQNKDPVTAIQTVEYARDLYGLDLSLRIVGDGPLRGLVQTHADSRPWIKHSQFVDPTDMPNEFRSSDLLLAPSHREGLPRIIIEALATGLKVQARANRGSRELLDGLPGCELMTTDRLQDWAISLKLLLERHDGSHEARKARSRNYTTERFQHSYRLLLETVLSDPHSQRRTGSLNLDDQTRDKG